MKARSAPLILEFNTWSLCLSVELNLLAWFLGLGVSFPNPLHLWAAYELRIQIPTLMFTMEVITDASLERANRAMEALEREFSEDRSSTPQDEE